MSNPKKKLTWEEAQRLEADALDVATHVHVARSRLDNLPRDNEDWTLIARELEAAARAARKHAARLR